MKRFLFFVCCVSWMLCTVAQENIATQGKVKYKMYLNYQGRVVPDFAALGAPDEVGYTDCFDLEGVKGENSDHYALQMEYEMPVKKEATYTFRLCSDDGSMLYIDNKLVIDDNGEHGPVYKDADIVLTKGTHLIRVDYFEFHKSQSLTLFCKTANSDFWQVGGQAGKGMPKFVVPQAKETAKRMKAWIGKDEAIVFPILTDVHTCNRETYKHIGYMAEMNKYFDYDLMVNLGDHGLNTEPAHSSKAYADMLLKNTIGEMNKYKGVWLYAPGNHDYDGSVEHHITAAELQEMFQKPALKYANGNLHLVEGTTWCYYDVPENKVRFIMLNSENEETLNNTYYTYGKEQLTWLANLLNETPENYSVMVMCHFMPHDIGRSGAGKSRTDETTHALMTLLKAYANKTSDSEIGLSWNFSKAKGKLIGLFTGDSHVNALVQENGVNFFITQGYGRYEDTNLKEGTQRAWFNSRFTLCCDVVVIKPAKNEVHTFRVGAGGSQFDYHFKY